MPLSFLEDYISLRHADPTVLMPHTTHALVCTYYRSVFRFLFLVFYSQHVENCWKALWIYKKFCVHFHLIKTADSGINTLGYVSSLHAEVRLQQKCWIQWTKPVVWANVKPFRIISLRRCTNSCWIRTARTSNGLSICNCMVSVNGQD